MKPFSVGALVGLLFASATVQETSAAAVWKVSADYEESTCGHVSALTLGAGQCTSPGSCSTGTQIHCTTDTDTDYKSKIATLFGSTPYVTVSTYSSSPTCQGTPTSVTAYAAVETTCHPITIGGAAKFFKVSTVNPLGPSSPAGAATISFYTASACTAGTSDTTNNPDIAALKAGGCDGSGKKIEISANWPVVVQAVPAFDGTLCTSDVALVSSTVPGTCTSDTPCSSASGSSTAGVICTSNTDYKADFATLFGTTPHVMVSKFSGSACTSTTMTSLKAYAADGKCHLVSSGKYYKTVVSAGGSKTTITFFSNSDCSSPVTTAGNDPIAVGPTETALNAGSVSGCDGATPATRYELSQSWPASKKVLTQYDGDDCTKTLGFISIAATSAGNNDCIADTDCDSGAGAICTTDYQYESAIATKFDSIPYVTIAKYATSCSWSTISTVSAYAADGNCHMLDTGKYYKVTATPFGGGPTIAKITGYTDATCVSTSADSTVLPGGVEISVTKSQINGGCDTTTTGGPYTYKISANWPKAMTVAGTGTYAVPATGAACTGTPSKLTLTTYTNTDCTLSKATCATANTLADCSTIPNYKTYLSTAFGAAPYLIKEIYSGTNCQTISSVTGYVADGTCYKEGSNSVKLVATSTGVFFRTWASDGDCGVTTPTTVPTDTQVPTSSLVSNACTSNTKYFMKGSSWTFASNAVYDDSKCALTPNRITFGWVPTCATPTGDAACLTTTSSATTPLTVYNAPGCSKPASTNYFAAIDKAFGMTTYVVQESYTSCGGSLTGVTAYVADAACHLGADAASSYKVTYDSSANATAAVKIETFTGTDCVTGAVTPIVSVAPAALGKTCASDFTKTYVGGLATKLTAVTTFSDKDCKVPVQTMFTSPATTCTASATCAAVGTLFTKTACTNSTDYTTVLTNVFGTTRRLVSDMYEAKDKEKCGVRQGIVAYIGDGTCHATLDATTFFKVTLGSSNTLTDATFSTFSDKDCTKDEKKLPVSAASLATATTAPCDGTNSIKWSIGGTEPPTEAPATDAPTPAPTTAVSTGSGKSAAVSSFSMSIFGLLASIIGGLSVLLN